MAPTSPFDLDTLSDETVLRLLSAAPDGGADRLPSAAWLNGAAPPASDVVRVEELHLRAELARRLRDGEALMADPGLRAIHGARRISQGVLTALGDPHGLQRDALTEAGRQVAYALAGVDSRTRWAVLAVVASRAAKNQPMCDLGSVTRTLATIDRLSIPARASWVGRRSTRGSLPVEEARQVALERVLTHLRIDVRREGRTAVALCPLHDDHRPSLSLHLERGLWYCHVCGEGGDGVRLVERVHGLGFADAVREVTAC